MLKPCDLTLVHSRPMSQQVRDFAVTVGRHGGLLLLGLVSAPLTARMLGPEGLGIFALVLAAVGLAKTLGSGGISGTIVYFAGSKRLSRCGIDPSLVKFFAGGVVASLAAVGALFLLLARFSPASNFDGLTLAYMITATLLGVMMSVALGFAQTLKAFHAISYTELLGRAVVVLTLTIIFLTGSHSLSGLLWLQVLGTTVTFVVLGIYLGRQWQQRDSSQAEIRQAATATELYGYGGRTVMANLMGMLNCRADMLMLAALSTPWQLGLYGVAVTIAEKVWMLSGSIGEVSSTYVATSDGDDQDRIRQTVVAAKWTALGTFALCLAIAVATPLIPWVFGKNFAGACLPTLLLLPGIWARGTSRILAGGIAAIGNPGINAWFGLAGLGLNLALNVALLPRYGATGAAIATSISYCFLMVVRLVYLRREHFSLRPFVTIDAQERAHLMSILSRKLFGFRNQGPSRRTTRRPRGIYVVMEPGSMNSTTGAYRHIRIGIRELSHHFEMDTCLPDATPEVGKTRPSTVATPVRQSGWRQSRFIGTLRDIKLLTTTSRRALTCFRKIRRLRPDFCYCRASFLDPLPLLLKWSGTCRVFIESNGLQWENRAGHSRSWLEPAHRLFEKTTYAAADHVFFVGTYGDHWRLQSKNWSNVENGVERDFLDTFSDTTRSPETKVNLCFIACLTKHHQGSLLAVALRSLPKAFRDRLVLHLIGTGFTNLKDELDGVVSIVDHGFLSRRQLVDVMKTMSVGIITGAPAYSSLMKLFDYGAAKLLAVVPETHNLNAWFSPDEVLFFEPGNSASLAARLIAVLTEDDIAQRGEKLYRRVAQDFTWESVFARKASVIREIIDPPGIRSAPTKSTPLKAA